METWLALERKHKILSEQREHTCCQELLRNTTWYYTAWGLLAVQSPGSFINIIGIGT